MKLLFCAALLLIVAPVGIQGVSTRKYLFVLSTQGDNLHDNLPGDKKDELITLPLCSADRVRIHGGGGICFTTIRLISANVKNISVLEPIFKTLWSGTCLQICMWEFAGVCQTICEWSGKHLQFAGLLLGVLVYRQNFGKHVCMNLWKFTLQTEKKTIHKLALDCFDT